MPVFVSSVIIEAPVAEVFRFHEREDALPLLTPPFPPVHVVSRTGGIQVGARVELRVMGMRWLALHTGYERNRFFVDEQIKGPFEVWIHRHEFEAVKRGTRMTDRVEYVLPGGSLVNRMFAWTMRPGLARMFAYRHRVTREICEAAR